MSLRYTLSAPDSSGMCRVNLQVIYQRQKRIINTGVKITPQQWDHRQRSLKHTAPQAAYINRMLATKYSECQATWVQLMEQHTGVSISRVQQELQAVFSGTVRQTMSFIDFGRWHIEQLRADGRQGHANTVQQHLNQFAAYIRHRHLSFTEVDHALLTGYRRHLTATGISNTTVGNYLRSLRLLYRAGIKAKHTTAAHYPFDDGLIPAKSISHKKNITRAQVQQLFNYLHTTQYPARVEAVRVWLCCFLLRGIDFVDLAHITHKQVKDGYITFIRQKTARKRPVPIMVLITDAFKEVSAPLRTKGTAFYLNLLQAHCNSNADAYRAYKNRLDNISRLLHKVGEELQMDRALSLKMNRHTFASISRESGEDRDIISAMLGHANQNITDIYIEHHQHTLDAAHMRVVEWVMREDVVEKVRRLQGL